MHSRGQVNGIKPAPGGHRDQFIYIKLVRVANYVNSIVRTVVSLAKKKFMMLTLIIAKVAVFARKSVR